MKPRLYPHWCNISCWRPRLRAVLQEGLAHTQWDCSTETKRFPSFNQWLVSPRNESNGLDQIGIAPRGSWGAAFNPHLRVPSSNNTSMLWRSFDYDHWRIRWICRPIGLTAWDLFSVTFKRLKTAWSLRRIFTNVCPVDSGIWKSGGRESVRK